MMYATFSLMVQKIKYYARENDKADGVLCEQWVNDLGRVWSCCL